MKIQKILNDKLRICDRNDCESQIQIGELAIKKYRTPFKPYYYHIQCWKPRRK